MSKKFRKKLPVQPKRPQQPKVRSALVDCIIPVFNRFDLLEKCLNALPEAADGIDYNVFIFDNNSDPKERVKFYTQLHDERIYILESNQNIGYPRACNEATKAGNSPVVFQLNDDVILEPGALKLLCMEMDDPTVGVCGMKLKFPDDVGDLNVQIRPPGRLQHICLSINIRGEVHHPFMAWDINHPKVNALREVWGVTGAALMTRRHLWNKVGGYDLGYGLGCLSGDTYVYTQDGIKQLGDIVGYVSTPDSYFIANHSKDGFGEVSLNYYNGVCETIKMTCESMYAVQGTPNHKFIVMGEDGTPVWKELRDIKIGDFLAIKTGMNMFGHDSVPDDVAYLAGLYIAEGSTEIHGNSKRITITNSDREVIDFLLGIGFR